MKISVPDSAIVYTYEMLPEDLDPREVGEGADSEWLARAVEAWSGGYASDEWFCLRGVARVPGVSAVGTAYLGRMSKFPSESLEDAASDYLSDLRAEAAANLRGEIESLFHSLTPFVSGDVCKGG